jgi:acetyl esterase/lipase/lysophospholipase L1-like esterase
MRNASILLLACLLFPSIAAAQREYPPEFSDAQVETYKSVDGVHLQAWIFKPEGHQATDRRPAMVFFFGGGWKNGSPSQFVSHCRYLASQGMVAITVDYRVRSRHNTLVDKCVADTKSAIRWVRQHADRLGIDATRVAAGGGSAGGHLALCAAVIAGLDEPAEPADISSVPNALVLFNPAVLLAPFEDVTLPQDLMDDLATRTGVAPQAISPIHHVRSGLPPTIIFHGEADSTVPFATVKRYTEVAAELGNRVELVGYRDAEHGFFNFGRNGQPGEFYPPTLYRMHEFLQSIQYLNGPPAIQVPKSGNVHLRGDYRNCYAAFHDRKQATVAFIGGSITEMEGYRVMVQELLQQQFPQTKFQFINAGISSTCSTTGAFRLQRDVLSKQPDLLFVEFAVNDDQDAMHQQRECVRGMEGILRHALSSNPNLDIVVTHFVNPPMLEKLQRSETPISSGAHERVAAAYGVSTIDVAREVARRVTAGKLTWEVYGGTHPKEPGNRLAAEMIQDLLQTAWSRLDNQLLAASRTTTRLPNMLDPGSYSAGELVSVAKAIPDSHWQLGRPQWDKIPGSLRSRFENEELLSATEAGAEAKVSFEGNAVGIYVLAGPDAGKVEVSIDDGPIQTLDLYHHFSSGLHYPRTVMLATDLKAGAHELRLRVSTEQHAQSSGHAVRILSFVVNR